MFLASCLLGPMCLGGKSSTWGSSASNLEDSAEAENNDLECGCDGGVLAQPLAIEATAL